MSRFARGAVRFPGVERPGGGASLAVRTTRLCCWVAFIATGLPATATAEDDPLEEVVVTGTRISRPDFESASPIVTVSAEAFAQTGSSAAETTLNLMPQFVPSSTGTSNGVSDGQAYLDLRGLGATRTLVLVDGRRLIPANGEGVPDLNVIPPALIESVEIVTGGASAVYGSDAIAGVVNLKLLKTLDGVEFGGRWGQTSHSDGDEYDLTLTAGIPFADGQGSVVGFVGYSNRSQVNGGDRDFSRTSLYYLGPGYGVTGPGKAYVPNGSGATEEGAAYGINASDDAFESLFASYGYPTGTVPYQHGFGVNADGTLFTMGTYDPGSVVNYRGPPDPLQVANEFFYGYNFAPTAALQMPLERTSAFLRASFEFNEHAEAYAQGILADYSVKTQFAPTPLQDVSMPVTNPYVPADLSILLASRPDPAEPFQFQKRMTAIGPRVQDNQYDTYQLTAGLRGNAATDWKYDVYLQFGQSDQTLQQSGNVLRSKVFDLTYAADGGKAICGGFNPFGLESISPACAAYIEVDSSNHATVSETIVEASIDGPLLELPAGTLHAVFGMMYRDDQYQYRADENLRRVLPDGGPDVIGLGAADNVDGSDHNVDAYTEVLVPLLAEAAGVQSLDAVFGYRYSDYASVGGVDTWKTELLYQPVDTVRLRGSYQRAVRAPSIFELYQPRLTGYGDFAEGEPCSVDSVQRSGPDQASVESLCIAQGVPANLMPDYYAYEISLVSGGNPDLETERATTYTAGVVFQPKFQADMLQDLQVSIDWYQIDVGNAVQFVAATDAVVNCYDPRFNPGFQVDNFWCASFDRDSVTGEISSAVDTYRNLAALSTSGVDVQIDWSFVAGPGRLAVAWYVSWIDSYQVQSAPKVPADEFAGTIGGFAGSYPEWKWNLHLGYTVSDLTLGARWRYIDSMHDGARYPPEFQAGPTTVTVPQYNYFDLEASYAFRDDLTHGLTLRAGIENLADQDPPTFPSWSIANTDASQYDVLGRRYFLSLNYRY